MADCILWQTPTCLHPPPPCQKQIWSMRSPGTLFGQCRCFLMRAQTYTSSAASATIPFATQKTLPTTTSLPVEKRVSYIRSMSPTVIPKSDWSFAPRCSGLSSPSTICDLQRIELIPQKIVWHPLPKWCDFRLAHMNPGADLCYHPIVLLSSTLIQYGLNSSAMFLFHASSIYLIWNNPSSYCTSLFVYLIEGHVFVQTKRG